MLAFIDPPTRAYNVAGFFASVAGVLLGVWALVVAYGQLGKTLSAARAARRAARRAERRMARVATLVSVQQLTSLTGELLICVRGEDWGGAIIRAKDLRAGIANPQSSRIGATLTTAAGWAGMLEEARDVQGRLNSLQANDGLPKQTVSKCTNTIAGLDEILHRLCGVAARMRGDDSANP